MKYFLNRSMLFPFSNHLRQREPFHHKEDIAQPQEPLASFMALLACLR